MKNTIHTTQHQINEIINDNIKDFKINKITYIANSSIVILKVIDKLLQDYVNCTEDPKEAEKFEKSVLVNNNIIELTKSLHDTIANITINNHDNLKDIVIYVIKINYHTFLTISNEMKIIADEVFQEELEEVVEDINISKTLEDLFEAEFLKLKNIKNHMSNTMNDKSLVDGIKSMIKQNPSNIFDIAKAIGNDIDKFKNKDSVYADMINAGLDKLLLNEHDFDKMIKAIEDFVNDKTDDKTDDKTENDIKEDKINISYDEIDDVMDRFIEQNGELNNDNSIIVAITRGGLIPAGILSYKTGIKNIITIKAESYDDQTQGKLYVDKLSKKDRKLIKKTKYVIIVDDIIDSGKTMSAVTNIIIDALDYSTHYDLYQFAIVNKSVDNITSNIMLDYVNNPAWIVFPWDK